MMKYIVRWKVKRGGPYMRRTFRNLTLAAQCVLDVDVIFRVRAKVTIKDVKKTRGRR